jgi:hypothetical protein
MADASQAVATPSGWSVDTLKEAITNLLGERHKSAEDARQSITHLADERDRYYLLQVKSIESNVNEHDRLYDSRFKAAEVAVAAALAAQEKAVNIAFLASEKAVLKAEMAQKEYNERSNEFRGQLDDQAKTLMARTESLSMFKSVEDKIAAHIATSRIEQDSVKAAFDRQVDNLQDEIVALREARSTYVGRDLATESSRGQRNWMIGLIIAIMLGVMASAAEIGVSVFLHK